MPVSPSPLPLLLAREQHVLGRRVDRDPGLVRVRSGVYAESAAWAKLKPWQRYQARVEAVAVTWSEPVFCLESAASLLGLPVFGEPKDVHVLGARGETRRTGDVHVHGAVDGRNIVEVSGSRTTSPLDTTLDLCRVVPPAFALASADALLRSLRGGLAAEDLLVSGRSQRNRRGLRRLEWISERATALAESAGESVSRAVIEWLGFEDPELQVVSHHEGVEDRSDFRWRRLRVTGESDGYGKYDAADAAATKAHFVAEKKREDRLRRNEGGFARWDWADTMR